MHKNVVYAVSLVLMSTTDGEVGELLPWASGTDVWYDTCTSWNGVKVGVNSELHMYGIWCFGIVWSVKNVHVQMRNQLIRSIIHSLLARVQ